MVVGGAPEWAYGKAEIYDLSGQNLTCPTIKDISVDMGSTGTFIDGKPKVCGGYTYGPGVLFEDFYRSCYSYNMTVPVCLKWDPTTEPARQYRRPLLNQIYSKSDTAKILET